MLLTENLCRLGTEVKKCEDCAVQITKKEANLTEFDVKSAHDMFEDLDRLLWPTTNHSTMSRLKRKNTFS